MYFDFTEAESNRVQIAAAIGEHLDPVGYTDMAMIIVFSIINTVSLVAVIYVLINRKYPPLKAKNVPLMIGIYCHNIFFFIGDMALCGLVHQRGWFFGSCSLMLIWFRTLFGNYSLGGLLVIRSYTLYRVFCQHKPFHGYQRMLPYVIFFFFVIVVGTITSLLPHRLTLMYTPMLEICFINPHLVTALMSMMWTIWTVYMITIYLLRNVRSSFNEFREMTGSLVILILCTIFNQIVLYQVPRFPLSLGWRIAMITIDQVTGNYIWWMIMGRTIYNCMFRRDEYLIQWRHKMIDDGLRAEYGVGGFENDVSVGSNTLVISQNGQRLTSKNMMSTKVFEAEQQSCSESTRIALEGLAALSESRRPRLISSPGGQWQEYSSEGLGSISSSEFQHRHSISYTRSTTCDDGAAIASMSTSQIFGKRSEGGMYANLRTKSMPWLRAEAAEDSAEAFLFVDSSPHEVISTSRRGSGRDAELEITIDAPLHARNSFDSHSSMDEQAQGSQNNRGPTDSCDEDNQKWQRSDTDLSAITTHFNSNRRLI